MIISTRRLLPSASRKSVRRMGDATKRFSSLRWRMSTTANPMPHMPEFIRFMPSKSGNQEVDIARSRLAALRGFGLQRIRPARGSLQRVIHLRARQHTLRPRRIVAVLHSAVVGRHHQRVLAESESIERRLSRRARRRESHCFAGERCNSPPPVARASCSPRRWKSRRQACCERRCPSPAPAAAGNTNTQKITSGSRHSSFMRAPRIAR